MSLRFQSKPALTSWSPMNQLPAKNTSSVSVPSTLKWRERSVPKFRKRLPPCTPAGGVPPVKRTPTAGRKLLFSGSLKYSRRLTRSSVEKLSVQSPYHWATTPSMVLSWVYQCEL